MSPNLSVWVAIGTLVVSVVVAVVSGLGFAALVIWRMGRTHQQHTDLNDRVRVLEEANKDGEEHRSTVLLLKQSLEHVQNDMKAMRDHFATELRNIEEALQQILISQRRSRSSGGRSKSGEPLS